MFHREHSHNQRLSLFILNYLVEINVAALLLTTVLPAGISFTITQFCPIVTLSPMEMSPIILVPEQI